LEQVEQVVVVVVDINLPAPYTSHYIVRDQVLVRHKLTTRNVQDLKVPAMELICMQSQQEYFLPT
jgi:hypothetical protein